MLCVETLLSETTNTIESSLAEPKALSLPGRGSRKFGVTKNGAKAKKDEHAFLGCTIESRAIDSSEKNNHAAEYFR